VKTFAKKLWEEARGRDFPKFSKVSISIPSEERKKTDEIAAGMSGNVLTK